MTQFYVNKKHVKYIKSAPIPQMQSSLELWPRDPTPPKPRARVLGFPDKTPGLPKGTPCTPEGNPLYSALKSPVLFDQRCLYLSGKGVYVFSK